MTFAIRQDSHRATSMCVPAMAPACAGSRDPRPTRACDVHDETAH